MSCSRCNGEGRIKAPGLSPQGLICDDCDGTGDYFRACVRRAYMRGRNDGIEAMRQASLVDGPEMPSWQQLIRPL